MVLENLVKLLTPENSPSIREIDIVYEDGKKYLDRGTLLWGIEYNIYYNTRFEERKSFELVYEGNNNGRLYKVQVKSLEGIEAERKAKGERNLSYLVFGSRDNYKSFFGALNKALQDGEIKKHEYAAIRNILRDMEHRFFRILLFYPTFLPYILVATRNAEAGSDIHRTRQFFVRALSPAKRKLLQFFL